METKLVSYDLITPGRDYKTVYEYLRGHTAWARPLESLWLIKTDKPSSQVRDELKSHIDQNDKVYVVDVTGRSSSWTGLDDKVSQWIKTNA